MEDDLADAHRQGVGRGEHDLLLALEDRLVLRLQVDRHHPQAGGGLAQEVEPALDPTHLPGGAEHEARHELPVGRAGDDEVLELALTSRDVEGGQPELGDGRQQTVEGCGESGLVEPALRQRDAPAVGVKDAEGGCSLRPAHHELGLVAEGGLGADDGGVPDIVRDDVGEDLTHVGVEVGQLLLVGRAHEGARAALPGVVVGAAHGHHPGGGDSTTRWRSR